VGAACPVLLLGDSGELDDVASVLRSLGVCFEERQNAEAAGPVPLPRDLLVATARRALALPPPPAGRLEARGPARVAVVASDSPDLRTGLRGAGFELLVRRPVHPTALRLLLLRLLYRGPERRSELRVSVGATTRYRRALLWRRAILTELSAGGCRLLAPRALRAGSKVDLEIPDPDSPGAPVRMLGRIVRCNAMSPTDPTFTLALQFIRVGDAVHQRLVQIVEAYGRGPVSLADGWDLEDVAAERIAPEAVAMEPETAELALADPKPPLGAERRSSQRPSYVTRVVTLGEEAAQVLMARDLSTGGIRVEPHGGLERGQRLALALHGIGLEVPIVVRGSVFRDDGDAGLVIRFDPLSGVQRDGLEKLMAGLAGIEALGPSGAGAESVLARILDEPEAAEAV